MDLQQETQLSQLQSTLQDLYPDTLKLARKASDVNMVDPDTEPSDDDLEEQDVDLPDADSSPPEDETPSRFPMKSLLKLAEDGILKNLTKAVDGQEVAARYCCGGSVPSPWTPATGISISSNAPQGARTILRWDDPKDESIGRRLVLPISRNADPEKMLKTLASDCSEDYGMNSNQFSVNFHPQDQGILEGIAQVLLPSYRNRFLDRRVDHRGVKVGSPTLRLRSGTSRIRIRPREATTPSDLTLGKLIVCLPCRHKGGNLTITKDEHSMVFDWDETTDDTAQWAAYVEGCAQDWSAVTEGTQLLLVYNIYVTQRVGQVLAKSPTVDPVMSPLYLGVKDMLSEAGFRKEGGILGYNCQHPYSHTSSTASARLPFALQGVDLVLYTAFRTLGLKVQVKPILDYTDFDDILIERYETNVYEEEDDDGQYPIGTRRCYAGTEFHDLRFGHLNFDECGYMGDSLDIVEELEELIDDVWPMDLPFNVKLLNEPYKVGREVPPKELAVRVETSDGPGCDCCGGSTFHDFYSFVGLLITVPKQTKRVLNV